MISSGNSMRQAKVLRKVDNQEQLVIEL